MHGLQVVPFCQVANFRTMRKEEKKNQNFLKSFTFSLKVTLIQRFMHADKSEQKPKYASVQCQHTTMCCSSHNNRVLNPTQHRFVNMYVSPPPSGLLT